jgi:hypothetical protein
MQAYDLDHSDLVLTGGRVPKRNDFGNEDNAAKGLWSASPSVRGGVAEVGIG